MLKENETKKDNTCNINESRFTLTIKRQLNDDDNKDMIVSERHIKHC